MVGILSEKAFIALGKTFFPFKSCSVKASALPPNLPAYLLTFASIFEVILLPTYLPRAVPPTAVTAAVMFSSVGFLMAFTTLWPAVT